MRNLKSLEDVGSDGGIMPTRRTLTRTNGIKLASASNIGSQTTNVTINFNKNMLG